MYTFQMDSLMFEIDREITGGGESLEGRKKVYYTNILSIKNLL